MIVNIRGTSGTGKSYLARELMGLYTGPKLIFKEKGRKQPIGYTFARPKKDGPSLAVIGHYETPCGGTDTISGYEQIYKLIVAAHKHGNDVLYEGLLLSGDVKWTGRLHQEGFPLFVLALFVDIDVCIASINKRRWAKNPDKPPVNPKNTIAKVRGVELSMQRLKDMGAKTHWSDRASSLGVLRKVLKI